MHGLWEVGTVKSLINLDNQRDLILDLAVPAGFAASTARCCKYMSSGLALPGEYSLPNMHVLKGTTGVLTRGSLRR